MFENTCILQPYTTSVTSKTVHINCTTQMTIHRGQMNIMANTITKVTKKKMRKDKSGRGAS